MSDAWDNLREAIAQFNRAEIDELVTKTSLRWLGDTGPVFRAGAVRIGALAVDAEGTYFCDGHLVVESYVYDPDGREVFADIVGGSDRGHEMWQYTDFRGKWEARIMRIEDACFLLDLPEPQRSTDTWARCWRTLPQLTDEHETRLIALGCDPVLTPGLRSTSPRS